LSTSISGSSKAHNNIAAITSVINPKMTNLISFIEDMGFVVLFTFLWGLEELGRKPSEFDPVQLKDEFSRTRYQYYLFNFCMEFFHYACMIGRLCMFASTFLNLAS
jgi:hypothetical protein